MVFTIIISLISILIAMIVHEFSHGFIAYLLGDETAKKDGRLTLNPLAHMDPYISVVLPILCIFSNLPVIGGAKPVPVDFEELKWKKWGMALVAFAGPLSNFILAFLAYAIMHAFNVSYGDLAMGFSVFVKILYPIAPEFVQDFFDKLESYGPIFILMIMFLFSTVISSYISLCMSFTLEGFEDILRYFGFYYEKVLDNLYIIWYKLSVKKA